jgi:hypothetical protein
LRCYHAAGIGFFSDLFGVEPYERFGIINSHFASGAGTHRKQAATNIITAIDQLVVKSLDPYKHNDDSFTACTTIVKRRAFPG